MKLKYLCIYFFIVDLSWALVVQMGALALEKNKLLLQPKISTPDMFLVGTQEVTVAPAAQTQPNLEWSSSHFGYIQQFTVRVWT